MNGGTVIISEQIVKAAGQAIGRAMGTHSFFSNILNVLMYVDNNVALSIISL